PKKKLTNGVRPNRRDQPCRFANQASSAYSAPIRMKLMMNPASGDSTIGMITLGITPWPLSQLPCSLITEPKSLPEAAIAAPTSEPTRAWLELDGRPSHQVIRFHTIAASRTQISSWELISTTPALISPEAMVAATAVPRKAPTRLVPAAISTACPGVSTFVATTVAIELAVSWKPLM